MFLISIFLISTFDFRTHEHRGAPREHEHFSVKYSHFVLHEARSEQIIIINIFINMIINIFINMIINMIINIIINMIIIDIIIINIIIINIIIDKLRNRGQNFGNCFKSRFE